MIRICVVIALSIVVSILTWRFMCAHAIEDETSEDARKW